MRVLHLDSGREMRGGQLQVLSLLGRLGNGNTLLTAADGPLMQEARRRGIDAQSLTMYSLGSMVRACDLVHAHDARCHTWAAAIGSTPLIVSRRVAFPVGQSVLSRWKYGRAKKYLAVSEHVKQTLVEAEVPADRIEVVYDGVHLPDELSSGDRIIALATDDPMKGSDLVRKAADLGGFRIHFSNDLEADLPTASLLVYITRSEGLGSAALLAMAYGVPVVSSRVGGLPEVVADYHTGILTENEPAAIADAILRALAMRDLLGRNGRRCVEEKFSVDHMVSRTQQIYDSLLGTDGHR
jgi:hypothetical protein